ncbi:thioesterase [Streptomyces sp. MST-110588]|nr:thioesterase [Streptomyces sp. MST-110588]
MRRVPEPTAHVLFFPHAGGAATFFHPFAAHLPQRYDLSAIQYPGRQDRSQEEFVTTVEGLAKEVVRHLPPLRSTPLVLFGHSMGAAVAFEVARRLAGPQETPGGPVDRRLVVSGRRAPSTGRRAESVHRGTDEEILAEIARLGGTEEELLRDPEIVRMILPAVRNDYRAIARYRPDPGSAVDIPLLCLTGDRDPRLTVREAGEWKAHTTAEFRMETFSGGHFYLAEHRAAVCRAVERFASGG